jgi:hypothetical protein
MTRVLRWLVAGGLVLLGGILTAWLSQAPYGDPAATQALLRLAWSGRPERLETCRTLTDEELEGVPVHMRQRIQCEGRSARYRLQVLLGGSVALVDTLAGAGARSDRPIHVLRDLALPPGLHRVELSVVRIDSAVPADSLSGGSAGTDTAGGAAPSREQREGEERARARREALPPALRLDSTLAFAAGEVVLVTYDSDARRLVLRWKEEAR